MQHRDVACLCIVLRILIAFTTKTFFQPDEFYQALEPAHELVFGYGFLTWEYKNAIRSISHPLLFAIPYKVLKVLNLDSSVAVLALPKLIGGLQAALADYYTVLFIRKYWPNTGRWALFVTLLSPWNAFAASRTFSNSLETTLTAYALYKWPFNTTESLTNDEMFYNYLETTIKALSAIGFAFLIRPTTALIWLVPSLQQLGRHGTTFLFEACFVVYVVLQYSAIFDSFYYGTISFPLFNFLRFNMSGAANFYGINNWHYYLSQGLPLLLCGFLPFAVHGITLAHQLRRSFLSMVVVVLLIYSFLSHKEVRFIMPILPILHGFTSSSITHAFKNRSALRYISLVLVVTINILVSFYATQVHQRGVMDLTAYIREHGEISDLTLLMPCHSTPWQSHIHRQGNFRFLTCEPPLEKERSEVLTYRDEADQFYDDPRSFMLADQKEHGIPEYVATFEASQAFLEAFWQEQDQPYRLEKQWFNSHFHEDHRRKGDVLLYKLEDTK